MAKRRQFSTDFKAKVALEAIRGELTLAEIAQKYQVHPNMIAGFPGLSGASVGAKYPFEKLPWGLCCLAHYLGLTQ